MLIGSAWPVSGLIAKSATNAGTFPESQIELASSSTSTVLVRGLPRAWSQFAKLAISVVLTVIEYNLRVACYFHPFSHKFKH